MTRKLRQFILHSTLVFSVVASASAQVLTTYTNGDVFLGFRKPGAANTLAVNLGSATKFLIPAYGGTATPGVAFKVPFGVKPGTGSAVNNLSADLTTVFGPTWANSSADFDSVRWAVVGISGNTSSGIPGYAARTLFVTRARVAPSQPSLISPDRLEIGDFGEFSSAFNAFVQGTGGTAFKFQQSTTNSSVAYIGAASGPDNWGTRIDTASEGSFGLGSGAEVEQTFGDFSGPTDSVLDLWISPNTGSTTITVDRNTYLGSFTLNTAGELTFTPVSPPVVTNATLSATKGAPFNFQIQANNSPTSFGATGLPAGLTVNTTTGLVSGTPTVTGTFNVTISAWNTVGEGRGTLTLTVRELAPVVSDSSQVATVGSPFSFNITAINAPTSYGATGLPSGLSVNTTTGVISGTPTSAGTATVTISATNAGGTGTATLTITVLPANPVISSATSASGKVGQAFSYQIAASNSPTSYGATGLPSGLSVNTTTGVISGTPSVSGSFTVTISATNAGGTGTATLTITVLPANPVISSATSASGQVGQAFSYQIAASNSPTSYGATGLPSGLSVNTSTGVISGTPSVSGSFTVTISATNAGGTGTATLTLTVAVAPTPVPIINSPSIASGKVGQSFTYQITASNSPSSFDASGLPSGLIVNKATGLISGIPTEVGTFTVSLSARNASGNGSGVASITISPAAPVISSPTTTNGKVGQAFSYQIAASNSPTSYGATGLPSGLSVNTTTGVISGTPTSAGTATVTVSAANAGGTGTATLTITILPANPVISSATTASGKVGQAFSFQIAASNSPTSYGATGLPSGLSVNITTGVISGTPNSAGTATVTISAINAGGTGSATLTITVLPANPVISSATTASGQIGQAFSYQIAASNSPTSYGATGLPSGLSVNTTTGVISGTPTSAGTATVTISATNAGGTGTATLTITILPANPVITSAGIASGEVGNSLAFQITASNDPTSYAVNGLLPVGLSLNTATGLISGTPNQAGTFTVTLSATNSGGTGSGTLTLTIAPRPLPVVVSSTQSGRVGVNLAFLIEASNAPTSYSARNLPAGLTINARTGQISGIPTQAGTFSVAISATNSTGIGNGTLTLNIAPRPLPVVISEAISGRVEQNFWYQIKASEAPQSYAAQNLPAGLTLNRTTGVITGTPTQAGTFNVAVSATNSNGTGNGTLTLNIAQQPAPVISSASSQGGRVGLNFSYQILATNSPRSFAAQGLPAGLTINTTTGRISGISTRAGTFTVSISATNAGGTGTGTLTITIAAPPSPPVVNPPSAPLTARLSQVFSYQVVASNSPTSYRAGSGAWPVWLRLNATTGQVSGTPNVRGNFTFTIIASNAGGSSVPVTIRINVQ